MDDIFALANKVLTEELEVILHSVYDGDTFFVDIPGLPEVLGERISIRMDQVDAPEMRDSRPEIKNLAKKAKTRLTEILQSGNIKLKNVRRGKFFRLIADVEVNGKNVKDLLLEESLVREYNGTGEKPWS